MEMIDDAPDAGPTNKVSRQPYHGDAKMAAYQRAYRLKNKERRAAYNRQYLSNPEIRERHRETVRRYNRENKKKLSEWGKEYYQRNKSKIIARELLRRKTDLLFRLRRNIRIATRKAVKFGWINTGKTNKMIGCTPAELKAHIEKQFKPGMTWDNYGFRGWHIDHIIPLSVIDLTNPKEAAKVLHYTNLQPLWWRENISKGNRIVA